MQEIIDTFKSGNKILICGNGGSAAEADHMAGELVGTFENPNRRALPAIALSSNGAILTSLGNDRGFDQVFARQVEAYGKKGDMLFIFTTSDADKEHSTNLLEALKMARKIGLQTSGLVSKERTHELLKYLDYPLLVDGKHTAEIQENQIKILHSICRDVERAFT